MIVYCPAARATEVVADRWTPLMGHTRRSMTARVLGLGNPLPGDDAAGLSPIIVGEGVVVATLPPAPSQRAATTAWWTLLALAGGHCAVDCCSGIWPVFKTLAHLDIATAGLIATIGSMAGNGLQLAFGVLADRGWRKRLIVTGVAVAGTVTLAPWAVGSYPVMGALVLVTNVGSAAFHPSATGAAANLSHRRVGFMIAVFLAGGYLGYSLSQVLFSAVYESAHALTPVIALLPLTMAAAIAAGLPASGEVRRQRGVEWRTLRGNLGSLAPLFAVQTFASAVNASLVFLLPDLLVSRHAAPWIVRGGGHFALIAGGCLSLVPAGQASDHWSARRMLVFANLTTALALGLLLLRGSASTLDLLVVMAVGAFNGINNIAAVAEGNRLLPGQASAVSALLMGLPWCVAAMGPFVAGVLADPARGGTPAEALGWFMLPMPLGLAAALRVRSREA
jgi:FSR family fosmidomycin resistance protein-like MFS transporter